MKGLTLFKISVAFGAALIGGFCQAADVVITAGPIVSLTNGYTAPAGPAKDIRFSTAFTYTTPSSAEAIVAHVGSLEVQGRNTNYSRTVPFTSVAQVHWDLSLGGVGSQPNGSTTTRNVKIWRYTKRQSSTSTHVNSYTPPLGGPHSTADATVIFNPDPFGSTVNLDSYSFSHGFTGPLDDDDYPFDVTESSHYDQITVTFTCMGGVWSGFAEIIDASWEPQIRSEIISPAFSAGLIVAWSQANRQTRYVLEANP
jgi:hypothetical protein